MTIQSVTLQLPDKVMRRARQAARVLNSPVEDVLAATLAATLPDVEDAPPELQSELARMTWLNDQALWQIARGNLNSSQQVELQTLSELQSQRSLTAVELAALQAARAEYGRMTVRKARAYAILSLRGGRPLLASD